MTSFLLDSPPIGTSSYVANKAYLKSLTKSWANENKKFNISSNSISPSFMLTNFTSEVDERIIDQIINDHPLKKILGTSDVAETIAFLANSSQQINGIDLVINAGDNII
ncbi:SDR family oxidoreductase [Cyclobacteriaceae bacterium]|nr:SDR family oxidoreductase [Cyclobacteriaceae bacterium]